MKKKKSKRGGPRPNSGPKPANGEGYGEPLYLRVKASQRAKWQAAADKAGLSLSAWVRLSLDSAASG